MSYKEQLEKVNEYVYELPKTGRMLVPGRIFASKKIIDAVEESSLQQVANVAVLPGIQKYSLAMPDLHVGYGFTIGGVAAFDVHEGIICPGGIGYDINCSVRLLKTNLTRQDLEKKKKESIEALFRAVPSGVGKGTKLKIDKKDMAEILKKGARWAVQQGYGNKDDLDKTETHGEMKEADPHEISERSIERGMHQLGSLGSGNHFLELQYVDKIFEKEKKLLAFLALKKTRL